jgi:predicted Ser/Thr protein kinase
LGKLGRVGPYTLLERLGRGGMGEVYLAGNRRGERVALKLLHDPLEEDNDARLRLEREVRALRRVESPYVARVIDADLVGDRPYLVMEHIEGETLLERVRRSGPFGRSDLVDLAQGMATALAIVHAAGVVHRDLKPANVLMGADGPILIDFGIAQLLDATRLTMTGTFLGTPGYAAPELFAEEPVGEPADVHAWGATVAFAATGRPTFGRGSVEAQMYAILNGQADLTGVPVALLPLIKAALNRTPAKRPTAVVLADRLTRLARATSVAGLHAAPVPATAQEEAAARRKPRRKGSPPRPARGAQKPPPEPAEAEAPSPAQAPPGGQQDGKSARPALQEDGKSRSPAAPGPDGRSRRAQNGPAGKARTAGQAPPPQEGKARPPAEAAATASQEAKARAAAQTRAHGPHSAHGGHTAQDAKARTPALPVQDPKARPAAPPDGKAHPATAPDGKSRPAASQDGKGRAVTAQDGKGRAAATAQDGKGRAAVALEGKGRALGKPRAAATSSARTASGKPRAGRTRTGLRAEGSGPAGPLPSGTAALLVVAVLAVPCVIASVIWPLATFGITAALVVLARAVWGGHWLVRNRRSSRMRGVLRVLAFPLTLCVSALSAIAWPGVPAAALAGLALWGAGAGDLGPEWWEKPVPVTVAGVVFGVVCGGIVGREVERVSSEIPELRKEGLRALAVLGGFVALCAGAVRVIALLL